MTVKYIAALGYTGAWGVIVLGIFRGLPIAVWLVVLALAFLGAMASWNALPQPSRDASQRWRPAGNGKGQSAPARPEPSQQA